MLVLWHRHSFWLPSYHSPIETTQEASCQSLCMRCTMLQILQEWNKVTAITTLLNIIARCLFTDHGNDNYPDLKDQNRNILLIIVFLPDSCSWGSRWTGNFSQTSTAAPQDTILPMTEVKLLSPARKDRKPVPFSIVVSLLYNTMLCHIHCNLSNKSASKTFLESKKIKVQQSNHDYLVFQWRMELEVS